ncbi:hypothetical protein Lser_V15G34339 [Lactuca serriola]
MNRHPRPYRTFLPNQYLNTPTTVRTHQPLQQYLHKWSVDEDQVAILNSVDMYPPPSSFSTRTLPPLQFMGGGHWQQSEIVDEVVILENIDMDQSFRHEGLTKKVISKNLKLKQINCFEEEGEDQDGICVICQVGFERKEIVGVLECKHRYHVECIKEWLFHKNVCPLCKVKVFPV